MRWVVPPIHSPFGDTAGRSPRLGSKAWWSPTSSASPDRRPATAPRPWWTRTTPAPEIPTFPSWLQRVTGRGETKKRVFDLAKLKIVLFRGVHKIPRPHTCTYIYIYICIFTYIYIYIFIYIYIYVYIYIHMINYIHMCAYMVIDDM